jgi:predicted flap endonuclease-1-like 5' DNA nuclease
MAKLTDVEGIGEVYAKKLKDAGVATTEALLELGATPKGRKDIVEKYADLLEEAGVDTIPELAQRKAENLLEKMTAVNAEKKLVRRLPVLSQVVDWIEQAKQLPRVIKY